MATQRVSWTLTSDGRFVFACDACGDRFTSTHIQEIIDHESCCSRSATVVRSKQFVGKHKRDAEVVVAFGVMDQVICVRPSMCITAVEDGYDRPDSEHAPGHVYQMAHVDKWPHIHHDLL